MQENKAQLETLYLYSFAQMDVINGLLEYIALNVSNSHVLNLSSQSCCSQQSDIIRHLNLYNITAIVNLDSVNICMGADFLYEIKNDYKVSLIGYHSDIVEYFDSYFVYISQLYDTILVDDYSELQRYKNYNYNVKHFYHGISKEYISSPKNIRDIDISFVGRMDRPGRKELFSFLSRNGFSVSLYGYGTDNGYISSKEMMEVYSRSKVVLNLTGVSTSIPFFVRDKTINNRLSQLKGRIYEGMISGALVFTEPAEGLKTIGKDGIDYVVFNSQEELAENLLHYLNKSDERIFLAGSGQKNAIDNATYEAQSRYLCSIVDDTSISSTKMLYIDEIYHTFISRAVIYRALKSFVNLKSADMSCVKVSYHNFFLNSIRAIIYYPYRFILNFFE
jgi:spore maturation protein CgeB